MIVREDTLPLMPETEGPIPLRSVSAMFEEAVRTYGNRPAMEFLGRKWTYTRLGQLVDRAARGLQNLGVGPGVKVGLCLPNTPYSLIFFFAVVKAGGIVVNFNPLYVERELIHQIKDSETTVMVVMDLAAIYTKVAAVADTAGLKKLIVCPMGGVLTGVKSALFSVLKRKELATVPYSDRIVPYETVMRDDRPPSPVAIDPATDIAVLQYTGGTTGVPKGAMLSHANITANCEQVRRHFTQVIPGKERMLAVLPFFHVFGMTCVMNYGLVIGSELILLPRFDMKQALATIVRTKPTLMPGVPTLFIALTKGATEAKVDMSSIRDCISGGAPLPQEVRERFEHLSGGKICVGYGLTETTPVLTINPVNGVRDGSVGKPLQETRLEIRSLEDPGVVLGRNQRGEVCARGPQVMLGYWKRRDETEKVMVEGALRTGDVGYIDDDGYLVLVDRIKDLIICGGYNVYPHVLEEALYQHPAVAEAVVIAVPDTYRGQAPKAFVTLRDGHDAAPEEIMEFLKGYVSKIEMPKAIEIRDSLPKTAVGKLSKKELIAEELGTPKEALGTSKPCL